jgi:hypothetical protein
VGLAANSKSRHIAQGSDLDSPDKDRAGQVEAGGGWGIGENCRPVRLEEHMDPIRFVAAVQKVQTLADGGIRVTLDLPETANSAMADLVAAKVSGQVLDVTCESRERADEGKRKPREIHI